ncbi:hypothetical protein TNCV_3516321 [Trichonephila clavipes]|nr:hypothetical protein TNCV_3516321 [Trichonephila clavipes]
MFPWPPTDQHTAIPGTKTKPAFIRNATDLLPPVSLGLPPRALQTAMACSQWNTRYRAPGSELSSKSS